MSPGNWFRWSSVVIVLSFFTPAVAQTNNLTSQCRTSVDQAWNNVHKPGTTPTLGKLQNSADQLLDPVTVISCFSSVEQTITLAVIQPARQNFLTALENYSPQQQQTSSNSSTAAVAPVSKVTGPAAIAAEFGGVNVNSSTSATTFQFTPATLLTNLAESGIYPVCSPVLLVNSHCQSATFDQFLERFTLGVSANTSNGTQTATGTAVSTSTGTATHGTVTTPASTQPTFGGLSVKGAILYTKTQPQQTKAAQAALSKVTESASQAYEDLSKKCPAAKDSRVAVRNALVQATTIAQFEATFAAHYPAYVRVIVGCFSNDGEKFRNYLAALLIAQAFEDFAFGQKPRLGMEYDFNTPSSKPAYNSIKLNATWQFSKTKTGVASPSARQNLREAVEAALPASSSDLSIKDTIAQDTKPQMKQQALQSTPPLTLNFSAVVDVYASNPPTSVPSSTRLRDFQGGIEGDYVVNSSKIPRIGKLIGDSTLALSYCYQDQTSPSILNGQPSGITFVDLPTTASKVYTSRGIIHLGQIRYGFGTGTNVSFPIALTYSNRSELVSKPIWGMQFAVSYNLTSLFGQTKSSK